MTKITPFLMSGPPASGKSSLTEALVHQDVTFELVRKMKDSVDGSQTGYEMISPATFDRMVNEDAMLQWNVRYGRRYGISKNSIDTILAKGKIPIIHLGRYETLVPIREAYPDSTSVLLWPKPHLVASRLVGRHPGDPDEVEKRLAALREEVNDVLTLGTLPEFDILFRNNAPNAEQGAQLLRRALDNWTYEGRPRNRDAALAVRTLGTSQLLPPVIASGIQGELRPA